MKHAGIIGGAVAAAVGFLLGGSALAAEWPDDCQEATLPSNDPNYPDAQLILTCLPSDFNGTLIVYAHGYVKPQEPLALPEEFGEAAPQEGRTPRRNRLLRLFPGGPVRARLS